MTTKYLKAIIKEKIKGRYEKENKPIPGDKLNQLVNWYSRTIRK